MVLFSLDLNITAATSRAGLGVGVGSRMMRREHVQLEISRLEALRHDATLITGERILTELAAVGFASIGQFFDFTKGPDGNTAVKLNLHDASPEQIATIGEIVITETTNAVGEITRNIKFKLNDKLKALQMLGQHHRLFSTLIEVSSAQDRADRMVRARQTLRSGEASVIPELDS